MKDKATFQNKVKVLNKLFDSGCDTEKKLQQLDMEAILKIPNRSEERRVNSFRIWAAVLMKQQK